MEAIVNLEKLSHRNKKRVDELGEVFTPDQYVEDMLDLVSEKKKNYWIKSNRAFFEPCCGHGNIVLAIFKRCVSGFSKDSIKNFGKCNPFYAVANSINRLWAIDIDESNIESTRLRIFAYTLNYLLENSKHNTAFNLIKSDPDFFAHILCAIRWHISLNESLSAINANKNLKTKIGAQWLQENDQESMDFEFTWVTFYKDCLENNVESIEFEKANSFVSLYLNKKSYKGHDFGFANKLLKGIV